MISAVVLDSLLNARVIRVFQKEDESAEIRVLFDIVLVVFHFITIADSGTKHIVVPVHVSKYHFLVNAGDHV